MNLKSYLTYQYLFQTNTVFVSPQEKLFLLSGGILVLVAIVLKIAAVLSPNPVDQKFRNRFYRLFLTVGIAQTVWYLCRYENVLFFGTHFIALIIVLTGVVWLVAILTSAFKRYNADKTVWEKEQVKLKYLPK